MRILIFHGYLLSGTGSNIYNARLAEALAGLGHEVHLLSQERRAQELPFVDALGDWDAGVLRVRSLREPVRCTVYRPDIGGVLPVYVADRYAGIQARTFAECSEEEVARYVALNVEAVGELLERVRPEVALANHLVMGPVILARGLGGEVPYAVKVHGSALEYTVKPQPERFLGVAREGLAGARTILVGSRHTATSLWEALADPELPKRTRLGPPGVAPAALMLEITESAVMRDPQAAARNMQLLRIAGVRFAIDDFGTGHSSLSQLSLLPVDELKIDRSFISQGDTAVTIVTSTIELGHSMGLRVVAEGVEDAAAWNLLRRLGCDFAQGYLISPPLPATQVPAFVRQANALLPESDSTVRQIRALDQLAGRSRG